MNSQNKTKKEIYNSYLNGLTVAELSIKFDTPARTIYNWIKADKWDEFLPASPLKLTEKRFYTLIEKKLKNDDDIKELNFLLVALEKLSVIKVKNEKQAEKEGEKNERKPRNFKANDLSGVDPNELLTKFKENLFDYQLTAWNARDERCRFILKSRQIGFTFYFSAEALVKAILIGKNQIFISASKTQCFEFRKYIVYFAQQWFDIDLKGKDEINIQTVHGTVSLRFYSTNTITSQGGHGDVYFDEAFWIPKFDELKKLSSAMASQKQYTTTYFSTPSVTTHGAYKMWSGDEWNERNKKASKPLDVFPSFSEYHQAPVRCIDGVWRYVVTIDDAEKGGCDLFDKKQLQIEYSPEAYAQLFMCQFVNMSNSVFKFEKLQNCTIDSTTWKDFNRYGDRPLGHRPVWIGYDPARYSDGACVLVLSPPLNSGGIYRVLERFTMKDTPWEAQAKAIYELTLKYNVEYIGIDKTGSGEGVFESIKQFYPAADGFQTSLEKKNRMVLKAQSVIDSGRIKWDASFSDIAASFLHIKKVITNSNQVTYQASRSEACGHADSAMAIMHALCKESLVETPQNKIQIFISK